MFLFRAIVILILIVVIFGGAAYFAYDLYWKPQELDRKDREVVRAAPTPPPDYTLPAFEKAMQTRRAGDLEAARAALADFLRSYPDSTKIVEARQALGEVNSERFFSRTASPGKTEYVVASRDSLARIASKFKSSPELIFRINNLENINLKIGQVLVVPEVQATLVIDHKAKTVTLLNNGEFFREYPILSFKSPRPAAETKTRVVDKIAMLDSKRIAFGEKQYFDCERWLAFAGGVTLRGVPDGTEAMPGGIVVSSDSMDEIFLLSNRGTAVTIQ